MSSGSKLVVAKIIAWDPIWRPMITHFSRLSWTYTSSLVSSWTWDGKSYVMETWTDPAPKLLSKGDKYNTGTGEAETWFHVYYDSGDSFEDAIGITQRATITMKTGVSGGPGGGYACDLWDSGFDGQVFLAGIPISDLEVHYLCTLGS